MKGPVKGNASGWYYKDYTHIFQANLSFYSIKTSPHTDTNLDTRCHLYTISADNTFVMWNALKVFLQRLGEVGGGRVKKKIKLYAIYVSPIFLCLVRLRQETRIFLFSGEIQLFTKKRKKNFWDEFLVPSFSCFV